LSFAELEEFVLVGGAGDNRLSEKISADVSPARYAAALRDDNRVLLT